MREVLTSVIVLTALVAAWPTAATPDTSECCPENARLPGSLSVLFKKWTPHERVEAVAAELGVFPRVIIGSGPPGVRAWMCVPAGQEDMYAQLFEEYPDVVATHVRRETCDPQEPICRCCPTPYLCDDLRPCEPHFEIPDGDADTLPDWCDPCTDSDGDLFGNPDTYNRECFSPDNCPDVFNPDQSDYDADGLGDVCDRQLTICHDPPGPRIGTQTIDINEGAFSIHQSHGDTLGPCDIENPCNVPFTRVWYTIWSHIREQRIEIIDDEEAWCEIWPQLGTFGPCDTTLIDFSTEVAIVSAIGGFGNTCHNVHVACVRKPAGAGNILVEVTARHGGYGCGCGAAVTFPLEVVKIPRFSTRRINIKMRAEIIDCD